MPTETPPSPAEALRAISDAQARLADNWSRHTWGYDLTYSALVGLMIGGWGFRLPIAVSLEVVSLAGLIIVARTWANRHGVWITGLQPPKARWIAVLLGVAIAALAAANLAVSQIDLALPYGVHGWFPLVAGLLAFGLALRGSRLWRKVYRRETGLDQ